ncbi:MAG TPA: cell envelope integrity protein CreD [Alphaproteobacteria bacterium]|nr:cell envelope integrity protein CreD [Alphaproteobacteria bacterium]
MIGAVAFGILGLLISLAILVAIGFGLYFIVRFIIQSVNKTPCDEKTKVMSSESKVSPLKEGTSLDRLKDNLMIRIIIAGVLILISLIPLGFVSQLVHERSQLYNSVADRMTEEWSGAQRLAGPILTIPYKYNTTVSEKIENKKTGEFKYVEKQVTKTKTLVILPDDLKITSQLKTRELKRGIYKVPIYDSEHTITGQFSWPDVSLLDNKPETVLWDKAKISFLISNTRGVSGGTQFKWKNQDVNLSSGNGISDLSLGGVHATLKLNDGFKTTPSSFVFDLNLRGSKRIDFAPTGKNSYIALQGDWPHPSFDGKLLPSEREITDTAFSSSWNVTHLSRSYTQFDDLEVSALSPYFMSVNNFYFGADLFQAVDLYTLLERTIKYGALFIALTFFSVFVLEFVSGRRMHWLQHLIIGGALSMFYLAVLAFSEHIAFGAAYAIGVSIIASMIGIYTWVVMRKLTYGIGIAGLMVTLYTVLFSILQMEDYALLIGTILLLVFLGIGMFITRKLAKEND